MKKYAFTAIGICLVFTMLFTTYGSASAVTAPKSGLPAPTVTPVSGDKEFNTEILSTANLPGVTTLESGMLIPVGFPAGEKQFEGRALRISKMDFGSATACFPFTGVKYGWGGKVGMWDGTQWKLLPTTITTPEESTISYACAAVSGNGYYTFIKWVADTSLLPVANNTCGYGITVVGFGTELLESNPELSRWNINAAFILTDGSVDLAGKTVTISARDEVPAGHFILPSISGVLQEGPMPNFYFFLLTDPEMAIVYSDLLQATYVVDFGTCVDTLTIYANYD